VPIVPSGLSPEFGTTGIWSGLESTIPAGWLLCDGSHGTPDLRNRFIVGAGNIHGLGDYGGATMHAHGLISNQHKHDHDGPNALAESAEYPFHLDYATITGVTNSTNASPPFYALCYIQKSE
jgi:hypothetical protein